MKRIATAGNTTVPDLLALESLGFIVSVQRVEGAELCRAVRGEEDYIAEDPVTVLGLIKLIELRGWAWQPSDVEIDRVLRQYKLG